jgi:hypothetical protein
MRGVLTKCRYRFLAVAIFLAASLPSLLFAQAPAESAPPAPEQRTTPAQDLQSPGDGTAPPVPVPAGSDSSTDATASPGQLTLFRHTETAPWFVAGQANVVFQWHDRFPAEYSGPKSFTPAPQSGTTRVETLFMGLQVTPNLELLVDVEDATGHSLSGTVGMADFPDLDAVRPILTSQAPYFSRMMLRWIVPLSSRSLEAQRNFLGLATSLPERRLEVRLGKFSLPDFFDLNAVGSDPHVQFLGWGIDINPAYDYAADTRGYTYGLVAEYYQPHLVLRYAEALEPKVANGLDLDFNITQAHSENTEAVLHHDVLHGHETVLRLLAFVNHADMGSYREAIAGFLAGQTPVPQIIATRRQGRIKYGFGANLEQNLPRGWRAFARFGWNNGTTETWAFTECDQAVVLGTDHDGTPWHRKYDRAGLALDTLAISGDHRRYLALGGTGFQLGDGALSYGRERSVEFYYTAHVWRGIFFAFDIQRVTNPGYNQDRGPVVVPGARLHLEF